MTQAPQRVSGYNISQRTGEEALPITGSDSGLVGSRDPAGLGDCPILQDKTSDYSLESLIIIQKSVSNLAPMTGARTHLICW